MSISKNTISDFIKGKEYAISKVYSEYKNLMYFVIANYVDNPDDCDDVLSEAFLKALEHKKEIDDLDSLKTFLCSIAKNEAINFMKKKRAIPSSDIIEEIYGEEDRVNDLLNAIEPLLTNKETIVVYYRAVFEYSWSEIEEITGIPNSTARRLYSNAKEKLKEVLL